jgi:hypothetical protein
MAKKPLPVFVKQLTNNGGYQYCEFDSVAGEAIFSASFHTCYFQGKTFTKLKGGRRGGNYVGVEDGEIYRIHQNHS